MDFVLVNPLVKAARSLNKLVTLGDIAPELEELMRGGEGNKEAMTERSAGSAVHAAHSSKQERYVRSTPLSSLCPSLADTIHLSATSNGS